MFKLPLMLTASVAMLALGACKPAPSATNADDMSASGLADADAPLPLTTSVEATTTAPSVVYLPAAPAAQVVYVDRPDEAYRYVDDAYAMNDAFDDAPPDYGFSYDGAQPWAWLAASNALRLLENTNDGERYYYYRPGEHDPYLVRDPSHSYAYSGGRLVTVYDGRGRALSAAQAKEQAGAAGRYLARARALEVAARQQKRVQVNASSWAHRKVGLSKDQTTWRAQQTQTTAWQDWRNKNDTQDRWADERTRRKQTAAQVNTWQQSKYKGPAPVAAAVKHDPATLRRPDHPEDRPEVRPKDRPKDRPGVDARERPGDPLEGQKAQQQKAHDDNDARAHQQKARDNAPAKSRQEKPRDDDATAKAQKPAKTPAKPPVETTGQRHGQGDRRPDGPDPR